MTREDFQLGVNYWPAKKGMRWWKEFDEKEVERDFGRIKNDLELDYVRIFLMWEDFQPEPDRVSPEALDKLERVLDTAKEYDLKVMPTFFTGHMSGVNWVPKWTLTDRERSAHERQTHHKQVSDGQYTEYKMRDPYTDKIMLGAEKELIKEVVGRFAKHPAICGWDLSNGCTHLYKPKKTRTERSWNRKLYRTVKKYDKTHPVTLGAPTFLDEQENTHLSKIARANDILSVHAYPVFVDYADNLDPDFAPFLVSLMRGLTRNKRPVLLQEFGVCTSAKDRVAHQEEDKRIPGVRRKIFYASEEEAARYYGQVLERSFEAGASGAWAWCYTDYDPKIFGEPPFDSLKFERYFGLLRADGSLKPAGRAIKEFKQKLKQGALSRRESDYDFSSKYMSRLRRKGYGIEEIESLYKEFKAQRK